MKIYIHPRKLILI